MPCCCTCSWSDQPDTLLLHHIPHKQDLSTGRNLNRADSHLCYMPHAGALCECRWSDQPDTVLLHHIPHKALTRPAKLADFDFCAPAGTPYPKEMQASLDVTAAGKMNGLVMWFDLHLAEGVSISSGESPWCEKSLLLPACYAVWFDLHLAEGVSISSVWCAVPREKQLLMHLFATNWFMYHEPVMTCQSRTCTADVCFHPTCLVHVHPQYRFTSLLLHH